jgi:hypothetical protein
VETEEEPTGEGDDAPRGRGVGEGCAQEEATGYGDKAPPGRGVQAPDRWAQD